MNKQKWAFALKEYILMQRLANPIPPRENLSNEEEWQCRIIGGEYLGWYEHRLPGILAERKAIRIMNFDPKPYIVITSSMPGLVAMQEILPDPVDRLFYLLYEEFVHWEYEPKVDSFTFHIHHWSLFHSLDKLFLTKARADFPDSEPDQFRIHNCGDLWAEQCGVEAENLWQWDGEEMRLLEEAFSEKIY